MCLSNEKRGKLKCAIFLSQKATGPQRIDQRANDKTGNEEGQQ